MTGNYLVERVQIDARVSTAGQSADFSADSRFVYYGADRLTLSGGTPTDKAMNVYDLRENTDASLSNAYRGNIRRWTTGLVYNGNAGGAFMPGFTQDANTAAIAEGSAGQRLVIYMPMGDVLTGVLNLQNNKIWRRSDWNEDYQTYSRRVGRKLYELSDHLGNVTVTLSDRKHADWSGYILTANRADVKSYSNYYPFGSSMPGSDKQYQADDYRYGFNGKEKDKMMNNQANVYDYGFRIYNPQIAKFLSVDPLMKEYAELTPYQFGSNTPIQAIDIDGLEAFYIYGTWSNKHTWVALEKENFKTINDAFGKPSARYDLNWNGFNTSSARTMAAEQLYRDIINLTDPTSNEPITIVAHSHGGNIAIEALNMLLEWEGFRGRKINLLTINTPVRDDYQIKPEYLQYVNHYHIFDPSDPVAIRGGNDPDKYYDGTGDIDGLPGGPRYRVMLEGDRLSKIHYSGEKGKAGLVFPNAINFEDKPRPLLLNLFSDGYHDSHNHPEVWGEWLKSNPVNFYSAHKYRYNNVRNGFDWVGYFNKNKKALLDKYNPH